MPYKETYPSVLLTDAVEAIGSLPGVGRRSALRLALHLLRQPAAGPANAGQSMRASSARTVARRNQQRQLGRAAAGMLAIRANSAPSVVSQGRQVPGPVDAAR